ncbi:hypothetical protein SPLC1_S230890 [Arthrospira platensis C1]|nr:hypothetical protein SPLC1_S230890 [Arthrospira platensis C1]
MVYASFFARICEAIFCQGYAIKLLSNMVIFAILSPDDDI